MADVTVPNFDVPTAPEPKAIAFRLLGREWACHPELTENALVAAQVGGSMAAYAEDFPEAAASIIADLALRFIGWSVVDDGAWGLAIAGARIPAETALEVMGWLSAQYMPAPATPSTGGPRPPGTQAPAVIATGPLAGKRITSAAEIARIASLTGGEVGV